MVRQRFEVLHDGGEMELVTCAGKTSQAHSLEAVMGLQVREAHLDALSLIARLYEGFGSHEPARHIPGVLVKIARDLPSELFGATARLEWTDVVVELGGAIEQCPAVVHGATGAENLAVGADVNTLPSLPTEVRAREGAILTFTLVSNRDMRRDPTPDEPAEAASAPID